MHSVCKIHVKNILSFMLYVKNNHRNRYCSTFTNLNWQKVLWTVLET